MLIAGPQRPESEVAQSKRRAFTDPKVKSLIVSPRFYAVAASYG